MHRCAGVQVGLLLLVSACSDGEVFVTMDDDEATAFVLAHRSAPSDAWRLLIGGAFERPVARIAPGDEVWLLLYADSVENLGLTAGSEANCAVKHPRSSRKLEERDSTWSFVEHDAPDPSLIDRLLGDPLRCDPCAPLEVEAVIGPTRHRYRGAAWFDSETALVVNGSGFSFATRDTIEIGPSCDGLTEPPWSLASAGNNRFWVGGYGRELARVYISSDRQRCVVETSTLAPPVESSGPLPPLFEMVAPPPDAPETHDVYAVSTTGEVFRWTEQSLELLGTQTSHPQSNQNRFDWVVRPSTDQAITTRGWDQIYVWQDGVLDHVEDLELPPDSISSRPKDRITSLGIDRARGELVVGTAYGTVWTRPLAGGPWAEVVQSALGDTIGTIWGGPRRRVVLHEGGDVDFLHDQEGGCGTLARVPQATRSGELRASVQLGDWLFVADLAGSEEVNGTVAWIRDP